MRVITMVFAEIAKYQFSQKVAKYFAAKNVTVFFIRNMLVYVLS